MENSHRSGLLSSGEAAEKLHRSIATIGRWARSGKLPYVDRVRGGFGDGHYVFDPEVVRRLARELAIGKPKPGDPSLFDPQDN